MNTQEIIYWNKFYKNYNNLEPTSFCKFVYNYFKNHKNLKILDIGCGNGRDSYYFAKKKYNVTGIDTSNKPDDNSNCNFVLGDMIEFDKSEFNVIYSRFTFHSIGNEQQEELIKSIKPNTFLCIETRSDKDINGYKVHGQDHYRNLTNIDYLKTLLAKYGFVILYIEEGQNLAIYKTENPVCIRVICKN